jgi:hypothetical protein
MTLVLTLLTNDVIVQASDRRFVKIRADGTSFVSDDDANKAVLFAHRAAYSYTGLAEMGPMRQRTDEWLAQSIREAPGQGEAMDALAVAATERFKRPPIRRLSDDIKRHEFIGAGWAKFPDSGGEFEPYAAAVSNFRGVLRERIPLQEEFLRITFRKQTDQDAILLDGGYELSNSERDAIWQNLAVAARSEKPVYGFIEVLIKAIRDVAAHVETVGRGALVTCLPRAAVERARTEHLLLLGDPEEDENTFLYVGADDNNLVQYGPIVTTTSGGIMSGFKVEAITAE